MTNNWTTWFDAAQQPAIDAAIGGLYARLDEAIAARRPVCRQSGRCCKFDSFGHRLYVTGLEIARFVAKAPQAPAEMRGQTSLELFRGDACVYQVDGLCSVHAIRPLGCRVFFCEAGTEAWQQDVYESCMAELRALHERHALPYAYMEWRAGLSEAMQCMPRG